MMIIPSMEVNPLEVFSFGSQAIRRKATLEMEIEICQNYLGYKSFLLAQELLLILQLCLCCRNIQNETQT